MVDDAFAAERLIAVSDAEGNRIEWLLDAAGNRTGEMIKDPAGQIRNSLQTAFDELNRVRAMTRAHGGTTAYAYDTDDNLIRITDADGRISNKEYDALDRVIGEIDALAGETGYAYDAHDNLISVTDAEGKVTSYTYNGFDDLLSVDSPDTGLTIYIVDEAGNRTSQTDARGTITTYSHDALNRLVNETYPDSLLDIQYSYDQGANGIGRLTQVNDGSGSTAYAYDSRGNVVSVISTINGQSYTQSYMYNGANRVTGMSYPSGRTLSYSYNISGRITQVASTGSSNEILADAIGWLPFGPVSSLTLGNGISQSRIYDQDYRVQGITDGSVLSRNYAYNTVENITAITDSLNPAASQLFSYDDVDRLEFAVGEYGDRSYTYDQIGNRQSLVSEQGDTSQTWIYSYESNSHRLASLSEGPSYQYDATGNTIVKSGMAFTYNDLNRLSDVVIDGTSVSYEHNALGQRVRKSGGSTGDRHYVYDLSGRLIMEASGSGVVSTEYAYFGGAPLTLWREETVPDTITPTAPAGVIPTAAPAFEWADLGNVTEYRLHVYDRVLAGWAHDETYTAADICSDGICSVVPAGLSLNISANQFWGVRARNAEGWGAWSGNHFFDYLGGGAPETVLPAAPTGVIFTATPAFEWADLGNVTEYRLHVYDRVLAGWTHDVTYVATDICSNGICSVVPAGLSLNISANHFWGVRARNAAGWGAWSGNHFFDYLGDGAPGTITPTAPAGVISTATPVFEWAELGNITEYRLHVYDRVLTGWAHDEIYTAADICINGTCSVVPAGLSLDISANHFWGVRARNAVGWGAWSGNNFFDYLGGASNLLLNGSFESGLSNWISCSSSGTTQTVSDASEGSSALQIAGSDCLYQEFSVQENTSYSLQCDAKGLLTQYSSVTLAIMDSSYTNLITDEVEVSSSSYQSYTSTLQAPAGAAIAAVTFYSEDTAVFDTCTVVED